MKKIKNFFGDIKKEMKKVKWPDAKSMSKYTVITLNLPLKTVQKSLI